ncbi:hypothetical protein [Muricoccus radiodurans]|uniref:hypothetical protein n=1 Tax=Muricoccus radiodurans TaxID=2231721 RepID=UPI003CF38374
MRRILLILLILVPVVAIALFIVANPPRAFFPARESFQCARMSGGNAAQVGLEIDGAQATLVIGSERLAGTASHGWNKVGGTLSDGRALNLRTDTNIGVFYNPPFATGEYRCTRNAG